MTQVGFRLLKSKQINEYYRTVRLNFVLFKEDFLFTVENRYTDIVTHETYNRVKNKISDFEPPKKGGLSPETSRVSSKTKGLSRVLRSLNTTEDGSKRRSPANSFGTADEISGWMFWMILDYMKQTSSSGFGLTGVE